jgi:hypothetical protein
MRDETEVVTVSAYEETPLQSPIAQRGMERCEYGL